MCGKCSAGFYRLANECNECSNRATLLVTLVCLVTFALCAVMVWCVAASLKGEGCGV